MSSVIEATTFKISDAILEISNVVGDIINDARESKKGLNEIISKFNSAVQPTHAVKLTETDIPTETFQRTIDKLTTRTTISKPIDGSVTSSEPTALTFEKIETNNANEDECFVCEFFDKIIQNLMKLLIIGVN